MSIGQIWVGMPYTLKPYTVWIAVAVAVLGLAQWAGVRRSGKRCPRLVWISLVAGAVAALLAPALTGSKLAYVTTVTDWVALAGVGCAVSLYTYLVLNPVLCKR